MRTKIEIDNDYINQANTLEAEFFDVIDLNKPTQHRVLKVGKSLDEFDQRHSTIWENHIAELRQRGFLKPPPEPVVRRDLYAEIDDLKARIEKLETG